MSNGGYMIFDLSSEKPLYHNSQTHIIIKGVYNKFLNTNKPIMVSGLRTQKIDKVKSYADEFVKKIVYNDECIYLVGNEFIITINNDDKVRGLDNSSDKEVIIDSHRDYSYTREVEYFLKPIVRCGVPCKASIDGGYYVEDLTYTEYVTNVLFMSTGEFDVRDDVPYDPWMYTALVLFGTRFRMIVVDLKDKELYIDTVSLT
jgi:hypothetical protein